MSTGRGTSSGTVSDVDMRRLYSLSLSQIRKASEQANNHYKPSPFVRYFFKQYLDATYKVPEASETSHQYNLLSSIRTFLHSPWPCGAITQLTVILAPSRYLQMFLSSALKDDVYRLMSLNNERSVKSPEIYSVQLIQSSKCYCYNCYFC